MKGMEKERGRWEANILGGSKEQSEKPYKATQDFWSATEELGSMDVLVKEPLLSNTKFKDGSGYTILTASTRSAKGGHPNALFLDEIDEMKREVFHAALFQSQSKGSQVASWSFTSTRHKAAGLMAEWVDNAEARGFQLYNACILEAMEACYDYSCSTCPLDEWCQGNMKAAMKIAEADQIERGIIQKGEQAYMGFNTVGDVIKKVQLAKIDVQTQTGLVAVPLDIDAELFNKRPSRTGLVYEKFDENIHVVNMIFLDDEDDTPIPDGTVAIRNSWPRYRTLDFGGVNPWVCLFIAIDPMDRVYIYDELYRPNTDTMEMAPIISSHEPGVIYQYNVADPSGAESRAILLKFGIPTIAQAAKVQDGIQFVKHRLNKRPDGTRGLYVNKRRCPNTTWEMNEGYRYDPNNLKENPLKENDHACDALKNFMVVLERGTVTQAAVRHR